MTSSTSQLVLLVVHHFFVLFSYSLFNMFVTNKVWYGMVVPVFKFSLYEGKFNVRGNISGGLYHGFFTKQCRTPLVSLSSRLHV